MRFMMMVKANADSEAGVLPSEKMLSEMGKYNEELIKAGMMLAGEGLHPSSRGTRVRYVNGKVSMTDGPFAETKELVAGFWVVQAKSRAEVIEWAKRVPFDDGEVEIRQVYEMEELTETTGKQPRCIINTDPRSGEPSYFAIQYAEDENDATLECVVGRIPFAEGISDPESRHQHHQHPRVFTRAGMAGLRHAR